MAKYVDGFVIPIAKNKVAAYRKIAAKAGKIWMKYGALAYFETVGDDIKTGFGIPFSKMTKIKSNEAVIFSWVVYKNKAHRNKVNKLIMKDPWITSMGPEKMPFDHNRMTYGGFKVIVGL